MDIRDGTAEDLPAVAAIYTHYVLNTTVTFNTHVRTPAEWRSRHRANVEEGRFDLLVAERDGAVVGFVETTEFRPKPAYATSIEVTVYVAPDGQRGGVGSALYEELFRRLAGQDVHRAYAVITLPNDTSVRFHERFGFVHRGTLTEAGRKFGEFHDVALYEKALE
ncbi:MAG: GNAT family N-acetyltransferase [Nitriliruptorales bacterium]|nr:GNAT family N-acetyltransferase [Nitriliruptorales bacterium]